MISDLDDEDRLQCQMPQAVATRRFRDSRFCRITDRTAPSQNWRSAIEFGYNIPHSSVLPPNATAGETERPQPRSMVSNGTVAPGVPLTSGRIDLACHEFIGQEARANEGERRGSQMTSTGRGRASRAWRLPLLVCLSIGAALVAGLPWILRLPIAQRRLAAAANAILAPSSVEFGSIRLSWFKPTLIESIVLRDAQGDRVLSAPRAIFEWSLWQILVARPSDVSLTIERGDLDIDAFADGTVDLLETLKPVIEEHPRTRLVIRIEHGRLRFRDPAFPEAVVADHADVMLDLARNSEPINWKMQLAREKEAAEPSRLDIEGNFSREQAELSGGRDLTLSLKACGWPWTLANSVIESRGDLSGSIDGKLRSGRLQLAGDATITDLVAIGDLIGSDTIHLDTTRRAGTSKARTARGQSRSLS